MIYHARMCVTSFKNLDHLTELEEVWHGRCAINDCGTVEHFRAERLCSRLE